MFRRRTTTTPAVRQPRLSPTGGRDVHPTWCAEGHLCTADRDGEHRSVPLSMDSPAGRIVVTRIQTARGRGRLEIRAVVDLPAGADARAAAQLVVMDVCRAATPGRPWGWVG